MGEIRVIGGELRGRKIRTDDRAGLRPTTDRARETIFNIMASRFDLEGLDVLDLFAGSGALGIEALSRGAQHATFVEQSAAGVALIRSNLASLSLVDRSVVLRGDAMRHLKEGGRYDLILADPPYVAHATAALLAALPDALAADGFAMIERGAGTLLPPHPGLELLAERSIAATTVALFRRIDASHGTPTEEEGHIDQQESRS